MRYPADDLTDAERAALAPHFTDLDGPVFALVNLPETVKGALFARYSRYQGTLRRLFLDEFVAEESAEQGSDRPATKPSAASAADGPYSNTGAQRAERLYERVFLE